jgi:hypothetical protein
MLLGSDVHEAVQNVHRDDQRGTTNDVLVFHREANDAVALHQHATGPAINQRMFGSASSARNSH